MRRWSLITRLTVLYALVSAALLLGMAWLIAVAVERHFEELDQESLQDKVHLIQDMVAKSGSAADLRARLDDALQNHPGLYVRLVRADGGLLYASGADDTLSNWTQTGRQYRALSAAADAPGSWGQGLRIWAALDTVQHAHFTHSLQRALRLYAGLAALVSGLLGWWAAHTGLAPLRAIKARAQRVSAHQLDQRMPTDSLPAEMADLAHSLNDMLARLQSDFQRLSDFSSDLAHELRTPISNLLTQTQVAMAHPRDGHVYREVLASNAEELQRLSRMVADMLLLAKAEHGLLLPRVERIALADEVQALFDFYEALAEEKGIGLRLTGDAQIAGDRLMLRRAISNLLSNALRFAPAGSQIEVAVECTHHAAALHVSNGGPDIDPVLLPRLFDRFVRADAARSHLETDGAGLGLAITQAMVQAHGGTVSVTSAEGRTRFTLTFPIQQG